MDYPTFKAKVATFKASNSIECLQLDEENTSSSTSQCSCCERSVSEDKTSAKSYNPKTQVSSGNFILCENCVFYFKNGFLLDNHISAIES